MTTLPSIDPARVIPPFPEIEKDIQSLEAQSSQFAQQYRGSLHLLTHQGLVDAIASYARLQNSVSGLTHVADFIQTKWEEGAKTAEGIRASVMASHGAFGFFSQFLLELPVQKLEELSHEQALLKIAPFLRYAMRPDARQRSKPPSRPGMDRLAGKLQNHLSRVSEDEGASYILAALSQGFMSGLEYGFSNPVLAAQKKDFLDEREVEALRRAVFANREALRLYNQQRQVGLFPEQSPYFQAIDKHDVIGWPEAAALTVQAHATLSEELGQTAESVFKRGLVEARPKVPMLNMTVLTSSLYPPMVFMGFRGSLFHAQELDHEVAHAVHGLHRSKTDELRPFASTAIDEVFPDLQEKMFWEQLVGLTPDLDASAASLDNFARSVTSFAMMDSFQQSAARLLGQDKKFRVRELDTRWGQLQEHFLGAETEAKNWREMRFMMERPFGSISYLYAQLVAERMWQEHQKDPKAFAPKLVSFLNDGNARPPADLLKPMGFDTSDARFWSEAFRDLRQAVSKASGKPLPAPKL